jgi:DNA helicase-2/ATP-dependent DNA helicase PcrA
MAEERRLAYVGITRAQQRLFLSRAVARSAWGQPTFNPPSRFLDEVPAELIDWTGSVNSSPYLGYPDEVASGKYSDHGYSAKASGVRAAPRSFGSSKPAHIVPELAVGDRVSHDGFGLGKVVSLRGVAEKAQAEVDFGSLGTKWLVLRFAPLVKL